MPNEDPKIFTIYIHWLYTGTIPVYCDNTQEPSDENGDADEDADEKQEMDTDGGSEDDPDTVESQEMDTDASSEDDPDSDREYLELAKSYVLGETVLDPSFQNAVIDAFLEKSSMIHRDGENYYPDEVSISYVFANASESSPIRRLIVDLNARYGDKEWLDGAYWPASDRTPIPHAYLLGLVSNLYENQKENNSALRSSDYHIHIPTEVKKEP